MKTSRFRTLRQELLADPTFRAEVAREKALMAQIDLAAARHTSGMTQEAVAVEMGTSQENVSRIERQRDVRVSTLVQFIEAQGGQLEINAIFPDRRVSLMRAADASVRPPSSRR